MGDRGRSLAVAAALLLVGCGGEAPVAIAPIPPPLPPVGWPPRLGEPWPDVDLVDAAGAPFRLSSLRGKVLLIEPVGMTCPACQAFAGGNRVGGFGGVAPQEDLRSIGEILPQFGGVAFEDERIVHVQVLLYSMTMQAPTAADARAWARHFGADRAKNRIVLAGTPALVCDASYRMIPGFQLVDRKSVLRSDSTGHRPRQDLYRELLPMVKKVLEEP